MAKTKRQAPQKADHEHRGLMRGRSTTAKGPCMETVKHMIDQNGKMS